MKFNKYFFENYPSDTPFDMKNPRYVLSLDGVDSILERIIVNKPYSLTIEDFDDVDLVKALLYVDVLQQKKGKLGMAVPFFVEKDAEVLKELSKRVADSIATELFANKEQILSIIQSIDNGYPAERNLYHILCGYIFDGVMFDYLEENQLVTTSCMHNTGLDYLVILYEDTSSLNEYSDKLLCSYNRLVLGGKGFVSFGDSNGNRRDFYRYMRLKELNQLTKEEESYISYPLEVLLDNFEKIINGEQVESKYMKTYEYFGYCKSGQIVVPIYDADSYEQANKLYNIVLDVIKNQIVSTLSAIQNERRLLAVAHNVEIKDISNEIYHLIFGEVNELLVQKGFVANPPLVLGEGRYLRSFEH